MQTRVGQQTNTAKLKIYATIISVISTSLAEATAIDMNTVIAQPSAVYARHW